MSEPSGLSFGVAAEAYDRGRPEWPEELLEPLPLRRDARVLDLGAGTGKLTRVLAWRYAEVVAVEPDEAMRARIDVGETLAGTAEAVPLADASVDGVFAAEAFHWFDRSRAIPEIARVLRPGGVVGLLTNRFHTYDALPEELRWPKAAKGRLFADSAWRDEFADAPFESFRETCVEQGRDVPRAELLDFFASISEVTALRPADRHDWLVRLAAALDKPAYPRRWTATIFWTRRLGP